MEYFVRSPKRTRWLVGTQAVSNLSGVPYPLSSYGGQPQLLAPVVLGDTQRSVIYQLFVEPAESFRQFVPPSVGLKIKGLIFFQNPIFAGPVITLGCGVYRSTFEGSSWSVRSLLNDPRRDDWEHIWVRSLPTRDPVASIDYECTHKFALDLNLSVGRMHSIDFIVENLAPTGFLLVQAFLRIKVSGNV